MSDLPEYYFRIRENGAALFRVDTQNRQRRIEMTELAAINVKKRPSSQNGSRSAARCWPSATSTTSTARSITST